MNESLRWGIGGAMLIMTIFLLFIAFGDNGLVELSRLKQQRRELALKNEELARANVALYHTIDRLKHDAAYIESVARHELGMVGKNDIIIIRRKD